MRCNHNSVNKNRYSRWRYDSGMYQFKYSELHLPNRSFRKDTWIEAQLNAYLDEILFLILLCIYKVIQNIELLIKKLKSIWIQLMLLIWIIL